MALNGHDHHLHPSTEVVTVDFPADQRPGVGPSSADRAELEQALADTQAELDAARQRLRDKEALIKNVLRDELVESRERLAEMDREHDRRIAELRAGAAAEVERLMRAAQTPTEEQ